MGLAMLAPSSAFVVPRQSRAATTQLFADKALTEKQLAAYGEPAVRSLSESGPAAVVAEVAKPLLKKAKSLSMPFLPKPEGLEGYPGNVEFDPMGISSWGIPVDYLREAELKHGRVCMLAITGFIATDIGFRLPGEQYDVPSYLAHDVAVKSGAMTFMFIAISLIETVSFLAIQEMLAGSGRKPGDFNLDPLQLASSPEKLETMLLKEITHARLAMLAFGGLVTQAVLTEKGFPYM